MKEADLEEEGMEEAMEEDLGVEGKGVVMEAD